MKKETKSFRKNLQDQRGNALFLILIAVALFAALSYAVTQSGRGSGTIDREQGLISASQITQFPAGVRTAVTRMVITGTAVNSLNFNAASGGVFAADGGGALLQDPPTNIGSATVWKFKSAPSTGTGWFITGIGVDTADGKDVFAYLDGVSLNVCSQILRGLGLATTPLDDADMNFTGTNERLSNQTGGANTMDTAPNPNGYAFGAHYSAGDPQAFSCVRDGPTGNYVYYHALVER